jgi:hypothetical protein
MKSILRSVLGLSLTLTTIISFSLESNATTVLEVEIDTAANTLSIIGTGGTSMATFATGNFPYVELAGFFSDTTNSFTSNSSPSSETLADFEGRTYQYLFDASWFISTRADSLSMLNRDLSVHGFDTSQSAFTGTTTWSISGTGIDLSKINMSGDVYANQNSANDGAETLIGTWQVIPEPSSAFIFGIGAFALTVISRRFCGGISR